MAGGGVAMSRIHRLKYLVSLPFSRAVFVAVAVLTAGFGPGRAQVISPSDRKVGREVIADRNAEFAFCGCYQPRIAAPQHHEAAQPRRARTQVDHRGAGTGGGPGL